GQWLRLGIVGFGGPPAHIALIRYLVVTRRGWLCATEFEDAIAACNLLPGPASTQLAIFCAYRLGGTPGALVGGLGFIVPSVAAVIALSILFLAGSPPHWVRGAGAGAGAAVAAVALKAGASLVPASIERAKGARWLGYAALGASVSALAGSYVVLVLLACGLVEVAVRSRSSAVFSSLAIPGAVKASGLGALCWTAVKVGALSFGGGFVIVPLMQGDAVHTYHWMSSSHFLNAVAIGQVTPGPVVATVAAVGYAAHGVGGAVLAATIAFMPSFTLVMLGAGRFTSLRQNASAQAFLGGAGPAAIGAILGAAIPLALALREWWQFVLLAAALVAVLLARRGIVQTLLAAGAVGSLAALAGAPLP
ncbi:MAG TPA: chromate efflux transporter, partial [Dehalococcoidia bacterium]|nr:chromate efflux transporter [Dehalococcoidia bacterium]